ncbi:MAG: sialidase family protein [Acidimicrobiales bacterium]
MLGGVGAAVMVTAAVAFFVGFGTTIGANALVNEPQPIDANNSPTVVRNPRRPDNLVVVHRVDAPAFSALLEASADGGRTWASRPLPLPDGADRPFAPDAAFAPDGTLFVLYANLEGVGNTPANLWLSRSSDGGRTMSAPAPVAGRLAFQPRLAVDQRGTIYITWLQATTVGLFSLGTTPSPVVVARSDDGGLTFSAPLPVSDPRRLRVGAASPVVDSAGRLHVLYEDFKADRRDFENLDGPTAEEPFALVVTRSDDGARSFSPGVEVEPAAAPTGRFVAFLPSYPSLAAGPADTLYVAWADGRDGDAEVFLRRSTDRGETWSSPVRVNDNRPGDGTSQYLPRVAVAESGRVDVLFLDRRRDPANVKADAYLASSGDGGRSFANTRISSRPFDSRIGNGTPHGDPDFGSRLGLASHGDQSLAVWTDTRLGTRDTGRQDIATATVRRLPVWPIVVWPGAIGLATALALTRIFRRAGHRPGSSSPSAHL